MVNEEKLTEVLSDSNISDSAYPVAAFDASGARGRTVALLMHEDSRGGPPTPSSENEGDRAGLLCGPTEADLVRGVRAEINRRVEDGEWEIDQSGEGTESPT